MQQLTSKMVGNFLIVLLKSLDLKENPGGRILKV